MSKTVELARHLETLHINNMYKSDFYWTWDKTDDEIEEACRKLINAMSEIEGMKDLWTKLDAIKKVDTSNMPSAVQNSVRSAISNAEEVTKNYNSTMDALKDAKSQLEQASNDIQSYQDLVAKIEEAQQVYEGLADDAAHKDALNQAIQNAQTALNDPNATIVDFNHANDALDLNIKLAQAKFRNAYEKIEAEEFTKFETDAHDSRIVNDGKNIGGVASGTWVKYSNVYFSGNGAKKVTFFYAAQERDAGGGQIHIRLGSLDPDMLHDEDILRMAGVKKLCEQGMLGENDTVVSVVTGNGLKDVANAIKFCGEPMSLPNDLDLLVEEFDKRGIRTEA